jgi:hypothetical protein
MNIIAKHDGHATVANFDSQYWQRGASDEIAAPQFGQLSVSTFIERAHASCVRFASILLAFFRLTRAPKSETRISLEASQPVATASVCTGNCWTNCARCAMLTLQNSLVKSDQISGLV